MLILVAGDKIAKLLLSVQWLCKTGMLLLLAVYCLRKNRSVIK